jgi:hypothetical protein
MFGMTLATGGLLEAFVTDEGPALEVEVMLVLDSSNSGRQGLVVVWGPAVEVHCERVRNHEGRRGGLLGKRARWVLLRDAERDVISNDLDKATTTKKDSPPSNATEATSPFIPFPSVFHHLDVVSKVQIDWRRKID